MITCDMCNGSEPSHWEKFYITDDDISEILMEAGHRTVPMEKRAIFASNLKHYLAECINELLPETVRTLLGENDKP